MPTTTEISLDVPVPAKSGPKPESCDAKSGRRSGLGPTLQGGLVETACGGPSAPVSGCLGLRENNTRYATCALKV